MATPKRIDELTSAWAIAWTDVIPISQSWTEAKKATLSAVKAFVANWTNVPSWWTTGQVLRKKSATDYDTEFANDMPAGWAAGTVLSKIWDLVKEKLQKGHGYTIDNNSLNLMHIKEDYYITF